MYQLAVNSANLIIPQHKSVMKPTIIEVSIYHLEKLAFDQIIQRSMLCSTHCDILSEKGLRIFKMSATCIYMHKNLSVKKTNAHQPQCINVF